MSIGRRGFIGSLAALGYGVCAVDFRGASDWLLPDSTLWLQRQIDDAARRGGGVIFLEPGSSHRITSTLIVRDGVKVIGHGVNPPTLVWAGPPGDDMVRTEPKRWENVTITGLDEPALPVPDPPVWDVLVTRRNRLRVNGAFT